MRNLKKILALVLALVMSLSLMATAGAAQFPDVDDSNPYKTAIDVLDELKVFQGFEDGTFKPTDTLNRAQAAVLVYRIATGDVDNKYLDNYTYMAQSKFTDLDGYNWAKGYINYCQNAGIVVGTSATTFNPGDKVTGYQLLVMVLRTLGYGKAGEFTDPKGWELQTAAIAEREGILKNVTGGDFGAAAPRQMVAEILFRGILQDTVEYSALTPGGYTKSGVALGKKTLGLDDIEGVVVANRIADLYDDEPMKDGQTRMIVDGKDYVIDMDTDATAIGLNHHAYVKDGKVLAGTLEAEGNVIGEPEHGEAAKVADLAKAAGIKTNADTDYYVNFDEVVSDTSNYRLEYLIGLRNWSEYEVACLVYYNGGSAWVDNGADDNADNHKFDSDENGFRVKNGYVVDQSGAVVDFDNLSRTADPAVKYHYDKVIPAKEIITSQDKLFMKEIFDESDNEEGDTSSDDLFFGEVYVGTKSTLDVHDVSNGLSHDEFLDKYINVNENRTISGSDNGEWLRVIDNNGDGVAEYVLRTDFIMTTVTDYEKRTELYNVEYDVDENHKIISKIPADEIRKDDDVDMSVGAVILYTYIDGYYYISNPEVKTLKVDTKSIEQKKNIFKSDDVEYTWSGIDKEAELYYTDISEISYDVNYDMYFDHFGFVRLATEARRNFVLLTDAYFKTDLRDHEWKVELYNGEEKIETADVVDGARKDSDWANRRDEGYDGKLDGFIDTFEDDHQGNRGTWKRLNTFGEFYQQIDITDPAYDENDPDTWINKHYVDKNTLAADLGSDTKDPFTTNIALASETDGVWNLQDVTNIDSEFNSLYRDYKVYELAGTNETYDDGDSRIKQRSLKAKSTDLWGIDGNNVDVDRDTGWDNNAIVNAKLQAIQTNGSTLYYYVDGDGKVTSWVGYQNLPEGLENFAPERAYAVTHEVWFDRDDNLVRLYEIADVVVFEDSYSAPVYDPQLIITGVNTKRENALGKDADGEYTEHNVAFGLFDRDELLARAENTVNGEGLWTPQLKFYDSEYSNGEAPITSNFAKYGIYAGRVIVADETKHNDYIEISATGLNGKRISFYTDEVAAYEINRVSKYGDEAAHNLDVETNDNIHMGDRLIVVCDKQDGDVKMVVNVDASGVDGKNLRDDNVGITKLVTLYNNISDEWANPAAAKVTVKYVDSTNKEIAEAQEISAVDGEVFLATADITLAGCTLNSVKNETTNTVIGESSKGGVPGYLLTGVTKDTKVTVTLTKQNLTISLTANGGTIAGLKVNNESVTTPGSGATTTIKVGDTYEYTVSGVSNATKAYTLTDGDGADLTEELLSWSGSSIVISGTMGGTSLALTLDEDDKAVTNITTGDIGDADGITYNVNDPTTGNALTSPGVVYQGTEVLFTVDLSDNVGIAENGVKYTVGSETKNATLVSGTQYKIPAEDVGDRDITISVTTVSTAPAKVTFAGTTPKAYYKIGDGKWTLIEAGDVTIPYGTTEIQIQTDAPATVAKSGTGEGTVSTPTTYRDYTVTGISGEITLTIAATTAAASISGISAANNGTVSVTDAIGTGNSRKYLVADSSQASALANLMVGMTQAEAESDSVLDAQLTDWPDGGTLTLTTNENGKYLVVVEFNAYDRVVKAGESTSALTITG